MRATLGEWHVVQGGVDARAAVMGTESFGAPDDARKHATETIQHMLGRFGATAVKIVDTAGTAHYLKSISRT
jgi:hypothetical protein